MKNTHYKSITTLILFFSLNCFAQLENANWYFGENGAGLDFNNNTVTVLTDGETLVAENFTATVSDNNGDLLFYTDGVSVWNKNHVKMSNGDGTLNGGSRTVSIVPFPGNSSKYYIFTIGIDGSSYDYFYSVVDMNLNNNLGDVEANKLNVNLNLLPYFEFNQNGSLDIRSEMQRKNNMVVAKHSDGESYWLILNPFDKFFALKININETIGAPIISNSNGSYNLEYPLTGRSGISISPNMDKIAYFTKELGYGNYQVHFNIFNFDNSTGVLAEVHSSYLLDGYICEFSSDGKYIYSIVSNSNGGIDDNYKIYQFDTQNTNINPILLGSSLSGDAETDLPTLVRGIDGKIYVPNSNNLLGVINNPNMSGTSSNYVNNQINLGTNVIAKKLPQQVQIHNSNNCPENLTITQIVLSGNTDIQEAENWIIASNVIKNGANAEYDASKYVKLENGFHAESGSKFRAYIDGCSNTQPNAKNSFFKNTEVLNNKTLIYPNPAEKNVFITNNQTHIKSFSLYDINGRLITKKSINSSNHIIDVSQFKEGLYILKISFEDNSTLTKQLIIK